MAKEITDKQYNALVAELKKNPGNSERHYAEKTGIPQGQIGAVLYKAELDADPKLKIPATSASVVKARNAGLRWPRIAAYAGISVAKAKALFEETGGKASESWTGRGRRSFSGGGGSSKTSSRSSGPRSGSSGRRGAASKKTATTTRGRGSKTKTTATRGSRGTRASAANPK